MVGWGCLNNLSRDTVFFSFLQNCIIMGPLKVNISLTGSVHLGRLITWRFFEILATHRVPCEDWSVCGCAGWSLCWVHLQSCKKRLSWFISDLVVSTVGLTHINLENPKRVIGKQCRSRSDAAECGLWSGFTVFAISTEISVKIVIIMEFFYRNLLLPEIKEQCRFFFFFFFFFLPYTVYTILSVHSIFR